MRVDPLFGGISLFKILKTSLFILHKLITFALIFEEHYIT